MIFTEDQPNLQLARIGKAVKDLSAVLSDAHRFGLQSTVGVCGPGECELVKVVLMNPATLAVE